MPIALTGARLSLEQIVEVADGGATAYLADEVYPRLDRSRAVVDRLVNSGTAVYGTNTGFGKLADFRIPDEDLRQLQVNLVRSHACGVGPPLPVAEVRGMMLLKANALSGGYSGARSLLLDTLLKLLNSHIHPVIPEKGSVSASGDLAPLAHLALVLIGEGEALFEGNRLPGEEVLRRAGIQAICLEPKEGLALLNGTQAVTSTGALAVYRAEHLTLVADIAGAMSLEGLRGTPVAFDERIHAARPHPGQIASAAHFRELLRDSEIRTSHIRNDPRVQDAYSLRCMPQVHGAARDALAHARETVEIESASATDNPLVFADSEEMLSGGNFHGAPIASTLDAAAIPLTSLIAIGERRIDRLVNPDLNEGLPPFLTDHPGRCSGFMIAQVTAAALLNEARILAHPASIDNVPTSGGKEDHVSMGMMAAVKLRKIVENVEYVLAIELLCAAQAVEYRLPMRPGHGVQRAFEIVRECVPRLAADRPLGPDIERLAAVIRRGAFDRL